MHLATFDEKASIESLSPGFLERLDFCQLSVDMINILNEICAHTNIITSLAPDLSESDKLNFVSTTNELEVRLLLLSSEYLCPSSCRVYSQIERCLALSLLIFLNLMPHESSFPPRGCRHLAARLNSGISKIMATPSWHECADLLLWIVFMGSIVAQAGQAREEDLRDLLEALRKQVDFPSQVGDGFGDDANLWTLRLVEVGLSLGASSREDIKAHLRRFLWVEMLCEAFCIDVWSNFEAMVMVLDGST